MSAAIATALAVTRALALEPVLAVGRPEARSPPLEIAFWNSEWNRSWLRCCTIVVTMKRKSSEPELVSLDPVS